MTKAPKEPCCGCPDDCTRYDDEECPRFKIVACNNGQELDWFARERPNGSYAFRFD
jgi:hypothetical protein